MACERSVRDCEGDRPTIIGVGMRAMDMTMDTGYRHYPAAHPPEHVVKRLPERLVV